MTNRMNQLYNLKLFKLFITTTDGYVTIHFAKQCYFLSVDKDVSLSTPCLIYWHNALYAGYKGLNKTTS